MISWATIRFSGRLPYGDIYAYCWQFATWHVFLPSLERYFINCSTIQLASCTAVVSSLSKWSALCLSLAQIICGCILSLKMERNMSVTGSDYLRLYPQSQNGAHYVCHWLWLFVSSSVSGKSFVALCPGSRADDSGPRLCLRYVIMSHHYVKKRTGRRLRFSSWCVGCLKPLVTLFLKRAELLSTLLTLNVWTIVPRNDLKFWFL
jgi:hypothetical protein